MFYSQTSHIHFFKIYFKQLKDSFHWNDEMVKPSGLTCSIQQVRIIYRDSCVVDSCILFVKALQSS